MEVNRNQHLAPSGNGHSFTAVLQELKSLLERERQHLMDGGVDNLELFAREKMQLFISLNHFAKSMDSIEKTEAHRREILDVNQMLNDNLSRLKFRMEAISEISQTIEESISEAESDGTYDVPAYARS